MNAHEILRQKKVINGLVVDMVVWQVPEPVPGSAHRYKYRLYAGRNGECLVRYDNERGKGDHVHDGSAERLYQFISLDRLIADFEADVYQKVLVND